MDPNCEDLKVRCEEARGDAKVVWLPAHTSCLKATSGVLKGVEEKRDGTGCFCFISSRGKHTDGGLVKEKSRKK